MLLAGLTPGFAQDRSFQAWIPDLNLHLYPGSFGRDLQNRLITLKAARNEYAVYQVAVRSPVPLKALRADASPLQGPKGSGAIAGIRVRFPGLVPVDENGQYTPDPLLELPSLDLNANETRGVWVSFKVPENAEAGKYEGELVLSSGGATLTRFAVSLEVLDFTLPAMNQDHFYFNILLDPGSVARMHKVERWSEAHWKLLEAYIRNWAEHSQDAITVFFIEDPWEQDTGFPVASVVDWKLAGAWESLSEPKFEFDYTHFDRFVKMCLDAGIDQNLQAWSPVNMPHLDHATIHYQDTSSGRARKVTVTAGTEAYERVWSQFAASFQEHLEKRGWLEITTVGLDELSTADLDRVVPVFRKVAPKLKLMVSGGDEEGKYNDFSPEMAFHFGYVGSEVPIPDTVARRAQGKRTLMYTANTPLRPNAFIFSKPMESRMLPWLVKKYDFDGYIRWAWNFWMDEFWQQPRYKWHSGDMYFVYPGSDGPLESIRAEMLRKGAQDYECLWLIDQKLSRLSDEAKVQDYRKRLKEIMEQATQEVDPIRPHRPLPSDLVEAREQLNQILLELR